VAFTREQLIEGVTGKKRHDEGGQGDEEKMKSEFLAWISRVETLAKKAKQEMNSKGFPGRTTSEFIGTVNKLGDYSWYDFYWG